MTTQEARFIERGLEFLQAIYLTLTNGETITVDNEYDSIEVIFDS